MCVDPVASLLAEQVLLADNPRQHDEFVAALFRRVGTDQAEDVLTKVFGTLLKKKLGDIDES